MLQEAIREGDTVIDATTGNGHDTLFLASCVGVGGRVLAFDLQASALQSARTKVADAGFASRVTFYQTSHERMAEHAEAGSIAAVMFNLGYLPGDDHAMTTVTTTTLAAMAAAGGLLQPGGILTVVCYPGHAAGALESTAVELWLNSRTAHGWRVAKYAMLGTLRPAPYLLVARRA
jgi:tRNA A58 N-methylase Trm61